MFQPQPARPAGHMHVEFKAGKCKWDGRIVTAEKTKGKIMLISTEDDGLTHFQWYNREKNETAIDLIVINDAYFEKIEKCKDGRVYVLRFTSSDKKLLFWMQEPKEDGDAEVIKKFNEAVGAMIPEKGSGGQAAGAIVGAGASGVAGAAEAQADVDPQLRAILQQFLQNPGAAGAPRTPPVPLSAVLTSEVLQTLMDDEEAVKEMTELLPASHKSTEGLREALTSPQLQQSLQGLSQAIHSDQLPVLLAMLGLDAGVISSAAPGTDALEVLCRAMEGPGAGSGSGGGSAGEGGAAGGSS